MAEWRKDIYFGPLPIQVIIDGDDILTPIEIVHEFIRRICTRAEKIMEETGKLEGAHYAAMQIEQELFEEMWRRT